MASQYRYLYHCSLLLKVAQKHSTSPGKNRNSYPTINPIRYPGPGLVSIQNDVDSGLMSPQARDSLLGLVLT